MLTAEYGGTGGEPIQSGMVVEEPDIEIGAGVSSKGTLLTPPDSAAPPSPAPLPLSLFSVPCASEHFLTLIPLLYSDKPSYRD